MLRQLIVVVCLLSVVMVAYGQKQKSKNKSEQKNALFITTADGKKVYYNEVGAPLPPFRFYRNDGRFVTHESLYNDAPLLVVLFNPTCEHCQLMAQEFKNNISLFRKSHLVFVAANGLYAYLPYFIEHSGVGNEPKIQLTVDSSGFIPKTFLYKALPQINIYNKERKLEKIFFSNVPIDSLRSYIE